ncbi:MAG: hypothetical protein A3I75_05675 [Deltaproteobacteria bacterium RIFCSPLOWO2_02_FULL_50_16]|nr:MAG: hypothetical protein A3B79_05125 [Deltaproteobacteria bacterium RIFCSPHIGHO2_02_FULL_50_15]OGQ56780.1 MAG: hypothetical protein A3I75_05675 [Deltaproteobacteria bacterium RIFCSPLOWO2_02_FULL_50_16]OGQ67305.1 MAG: hypothetical protein A3F89_04510 [Deltaproteobacteria bacterium RIFCSPLOWO2_12_FULL_50_11]
MSEGEIVVIYLSERLDQKTMKTIAKKNFEIRQVTQEQFFATFPSQRPDLVILTFKKNQHDTAVQIIEQIKGQDENLPIICLTDVSVENVVGLMKQGAYDYYKTPPDIVKLRLAISHAMGTYKLTKRVSLLENQVGWQGKFDEIVGVSSSMQEIFQTIQTVAKSNATVLILGESGTGKELVAKAIHRHSDRRKYKFIDINCGAIPRELLENELFGHERGAYTGADRQYVGSCERAHQGTLFLDEICEMDPSLQVKILRVLQERNIVRVGGGQKIEIDIRIIAATNRDIQAEVEKGNFREDLYYRLNVVPIHIPPLRVRRDDIMVLGRCFLERYSKENNKKFKDFSPDAMQVLTNYNWPGNVRELENAIERLVVLNDDTKVRLSFLPHFIQNAERQVMAGTTVSSSDSYQKVVPLPLVEQYAIEAAIAKCNGDVVLAAKKLQIGQATMYRKIKHYGIKLD